MSLFADEPVAAAPAPVPAPPPVAPAPAPPATQYAGTGGAPPAAQAAAYPQYAEDGDAPLVTGVPDQVAAANAPAEIGPPAPSEMTTGVPDQVAAAQSPEEAAKAKRDAAVKDELAKMTPEQKAAAEAKAKEVASKLSTELSKTHLIGNNFDVTDQLRGLSPAEMELVKQQYKDQAASRGEKVDLEKDLRSGLEGADLAVAEAALSGDKAATAAALVEQAADGIGTDTERWKLAMDTLKTKEERDEFKALLDKKHGGTGGSAYKEMVKSETSSFDRDRLNAMAISDDDERDGQLAAVEVTQNAYGGKFATIVEGITDSVTDHMDVSEEERMRGRTAMRENGSFVQLSNLGGDEDKQLDAVESVAGDPKKRAAFEKAMLATNGVPAAETLASELHDPLSDITVDGKPMVSDHRAEAAKDLLAGRTNDAKARRMMAHLDNYVNDNEDGATKMLEGMKPEDRAAVMKKADELAKADGHESASTMLDDELSPAQRAVAKEREKDGKVDEMTALYEAGDTVMGLGKKTETFYSTLQGKKPAEIKAMKAKFEAAHPGENFEEWVKSKATSDGEKRDFKILLEGDYARMTPEERKKEGITDQMLIQRMKDLNAAARDGAEERKGDILGNAKRAAGNEIGNYMGDSMSNAGDRLDDRMKVAEEMEAKLASGQELTPEEQARLVQNMDYMANDQKAFTETKTEVVNKSAEVVGTAVQIGVTAVAGDTAGEVAGGVAKMEVKGSLNSGRYSVDEQIADGAEILGSMAGKGIGGGPLAEGAVGGVASTLGDTKNWRDAGNMAESGIKNVGEGMATAAASEVIETGYGDAAKDGIASKVTQAVAETAMTGDHNKSIGELAKDTAISAAKDYATSRAANGHKARSDAAVADAARRAEAQRAAAQVAQAQSDLDGMAKPVSPEQRAADNAAEGKRVLDGLDAADAKDIARDADNAAEAKRVLDKLDADDQPIEGKPIYPVTDDNHVVVHENPPRVEQRPSERAAEQVAQAERDLDGMRKPVTPEQRDADNAAQAKRALALLDDTPIYGDPIYDVGGDRPVIVREKPLGPVQSKFGDETIGITHKRELRAETKDGPVDARLVANRIDMTFPEGMDRAGKEALMRDAAHRMDRDMSDEAIKRALDENPQASKVPVDLTLHVKDPAETAKLAKEMLDPDAPPLDATGDCTVDSLTWQKRLAEQGIHVPIIDGNRSHRYLVVGNQIMCPTFQQMGGKGPFVGTYNEMVEQLGGKDLTPEKRLEVMQKIEKDFGIKPKAEGDDALPVEFNDTTRPFGSESDTGALQPDGYEETRRIMREQEAAGIPPGQGIAPDLVQGAREGRVDLPGPKPKRVQSPTDVKGKKKVLPDGTEVYEDDLDPFR